MSEDVSGDQCFLCQAVELWCHSPSDSPASKPVLALARLESHKITTSVCVDPHACLASTPEVLAAVSSGEGPW